LHFNDKTSRSFSWTKHLILQGSFPSVFDDIDHFLRLVSAAVLPNHENLAEKRVEDDEASVEMFAVISFFVFHIIFYLCPFQKNFY